MEALAIEKLKGLHFKISEKNCSSVYFVEDLDKIDEIHPKIAISLDKAQIFGADAVYFRFFEGNRMPIPQVYIYDNTTSKYSSDELVTIHKKIWSASEIPCFIVIGKTSIQVYDSRKPITIKNGKQTHNALFIDDVNELINDFNSKLLDNGELWERRKQNFKYETSAFEVMLEGLHFAKTLIKKQLWDIKDNLLNRLLILSILIKYLEDNSIDDSNVNFSELFYEKNIGCKSFTEAIREKKIVEMLDCLSMHFNGGVFRISEQDKLVLKSADLDILASFLEGQLEDNGQMLIWEQYSFKHIPIELISNFLEEFIPKDIKDKNGVVYTPSYLVNFLVDECLPLDKDNINYNVKLIDVSCGSGIFLATAFRRLIERWRIAKAKSNELGEISIEDIQSILHKNIFGVDISDTATELTKFSLNVTLCSMLTPKQIWTKLKFKDLSNNIKNQDFFDFIGSNNIQYDLVIGNPPFGSIDRHNYNTKLKHLFDIKIRDFQKSIMFLEKSMDLLCQNGLLCLIQEAGPLLHNNNSFAFREHFFKKNNVLQILDFSFLRDSLYNSANVSTVAIFAQKSTPSMDDILHIIVDKVISNKEKIYLELNHYNFHNIPYAIAIDPDYQFVWKANILGGNRVFGLVRKIKGHKFPSLKSYAQEHKFIIGQGYIGGKQNSNKKSDYITNKERIVNSGFNSNGICKTEIEKSTHFHDISNYQLFFPPHFFIKKSFKDNNFVIAYSDKYLTFRNEIIGIHSDNKEELLCLFNSIKHNEYLYKFLMLTTSGRSIISRSKSSYKANDIYALPIIMDKVLELNKADLIVIDDTINYYLETNIDTIYNNCTIEQLKEFATVYSDALNGIYKQGEQEYSLSTIYDNQSYYALEFCFSESKTTSKVQNNTENLDRLIDNEVSDNLLIKRVIRLYRDNSIILIKPKQLRYWLKSIALRDYDETLAEAFDFINQ